MLAEGVAVIDPVGDTEEDPVSDTVGV